MNITSDITTKMVPQKSINVNIELTEEEAAAFIKHYGCVSGCSHQVTKDLFNEISQALSKPPVDEAPTNPQHPYPVGKKVWFEYYGCDKHMPIRAYGTVKSTNQATPLYYTILDSNGNEHYVDSIYVSASVVQ